LSKLFRVSLASGMKGDYAERVHENPEGLPGKGPAKRGEP